MFKYTEKDLNLNQAQLRELCDQNDIAWEDKMSKAQLKALLLMVTVQDEEGTDSSETPTDETPADPAPSETPTDETETEVPAEEPKDTPEPAKEPEQEKAPAPFPEEKVEDKPNKVETPSASNLALQQEIARRQSRYGMSTPEAKEGAAAKEALLQEVARRQSRYGISTDSTDPTLALQQEIARRQSRYMQ